MTVRDSGVPELIPGPARDPDGRLPQYFDAKNGKYKFILFWNEGKQCYSLDLKFDKDGKSWHFVYDQNKYQGGSYSRPKLWKDYREQPSIYSTNEAFKCIPYKKNDRQVVMQVIEYYDVFFPFPFPHTEEKIKRTLYFDRVFDKEGNLS